jgi:hypothetical protein
MVIPTAFKMYKNTNRGQDPKTLKTIPLSCDTVKCTLDIVRDTVEQLLLKIQESVRSSTQLHKCTDIINMAQ